MLYQLGGEHPPAGRPRTSCREAKTTSPSQTRVNHVLWAGYPIAAALVMTPLLDALTRTWPIRLAEVGWRFGASGIVLNTLVTPLLGIFVAISVASLLGHRPVVRSLSIICWVIGALVAATVGMFLLDSLQVRGEVAVENRGQFTAPTAKAVILGAITILVAIWLGVSGFRASRRRR